MHDKKLTCLSRILTDFTTILISKNLSIFVIVLEFYNVVY